MKRDKITVALRNKISALAFDIECCAMYDDHLANSDRKFLSDTLREAVKFIEEQINI